MVRNSTQPVELPCLAGSVGRARARNLVVVGLSPIQEGSSVLSFQSIALTYSNMPDMLLRNAMCCMYVQDAMYIHVHNICYGNKRDCAIIGYDITLTQTTTLQHISYHIHLYISVSTLHIANTHIHSVDVRT